MMMTKLLQALEVAKPAFVILHEMWDDTGERLSVQAPDLDNKRVHMSLEVFVSRFAVTFGLEGIHQPVTVELVTPPGLVRTPSAANIFDALFGYPFTGTLQTMFRKLLSLAKIKLVVDECDAASGNDKLHAFVMTLDLLGTDDSVLQVLKEQFLCGLHQNLVVTSLIQCLGADLVSSM